MGLGCVGQICKLVQKAVKGDPKPLFENIKATVNVPGGLDSIGWKIKKKKVKMEFDYHARGSKEGSEFAGFAEWWIFEKLKHCCAGDQSDKLMYKNQGKYTTMSSGLAQWDFKKANRKNDETGEPMPFFNGNGRWNHKENPVPTNQSEGQDITKENWGVLAKAAAQGGRKSRRKRRKSRRKKSRRKKRGRKRRRTKKKRRRRR